jgi:hypothetical protein
MQHLTQTLLLEAHVRAAWQTQLAAAVHTPGLLPELVRRRAELLPRFAAYYTQLRALPRRMRRALQRQWRLPLAGVALLLALGQSPGLAATIPVGDVCTLIDAITAANTDTATGGCPAGSGADTVVLPMSGAQTLNEVNNDTYGPTGLPVISSVITIAGQGSTIARDNGAPYFRIVAVNSTGDLTLQETTISGGIAPAPYYVPPHNGGGVANYGGTLTVLNSTISGNAAAVYCTAFCYSGSGGGVANLGGTLIVTNSTIAGNSALFSGGGVANLGGTLIVTNSTISGNGDGGVRNYGTGTVTNSTISGNVGNFGGGVLNNGTLTVLNSTITGNRVFGYSGDAGCRPGYGGGVLNSFGGTLTLVRTLVSGNTAFRCGPFIGPLGLGPEIFNNVYNATVFADSHNLFGVNGTTGVEGFSPGATDIVPSAGVLLPHILRPRLAANGGPTQTHALVPGSPAIDAGGAVCLDATGAPLLTDQRGQPRLVDGDENGTAACDIGAFEFTPLVGATIPVTAHCTLVDAITAANTDTATGGCPAGRGADTIVLPVRSTQTLTSVNNSTYGPTGLPVIRSAITIEGQGSTIVRATSAPAFRIVAVHDTEELTLNETTVSGGGTPDSGGGVINFGILTITNSTISGNEAYAGGGVANHSSSFFSAGFLTVINSTISGNTATATSFFSGGGGLANFDLSTLTILNSTIMDNAAPSGGGVANKDFGFTRGTVTVTRSAITGNSATYFGGGVANEGTLTVTNSTISGNAATFSSGGGVANGGLFGFLTILDSTITGNTATFSSGGGMANGADGTLARTLVSGNTAPYAPEIAGFVRADNHNLFGVDGSAGVEGFSPGPTDIVSPAGVLLPDILEPTLAFNGGLTQTHALVLGSPAIDAGSAMCLDATGAPLATDQRGRPRLVDGDGDGTAACDIGAFEFFPVVNDFVTLDPALDTAFDPTPGPAAPAGTFTITATFTNTRDRALRFPFFTVTELSGGNLLLNADEGTQGVGATVTPEIGDHVLAPDETVTVEFVIGLQEQKRFTFFVDLFGEPVP